MDSKNNEIIRSNDVEEEDFDNDPSYKRFSLEISGINKDDVELENNKFESLSDAKLITSVDMAILLSALKLLPNNLERLNHLDEFKLPFLFTSQNVIDIMNITLSVKTRLSILALLGPRLVDPTAKLHEFIDSFRFSEEKERVESILKKRSSIIGSAIYKKSQVRSSLGRTRRPSAADFQASSNSTSPLPQSKQGKLSDSLSNAVSMIDSTNNTDVGITPSRVNNNNINNNNIVYSTPSINANLNNNGWTPYDKEKVDNNIIDNEDIDLDINMDVNDPDYPLSPSSKSYLSSPSSNGNVNIQADELNINIISNQTTSSPNEPLQKKQSRRGSFPPSSPKNNNNQIEEKNNEIDSQQEIKHSGGCCIIS